MNSHLYLLCVFLNLIHTNDALQQYYFTIWNVRISKQSGGKKIKTLEVAAQQLCPCLGPVFV